MPYSHSGTQLYPSRVGASELEATVAPSEVQLVCGYSQFRAVFRQALLWAVACDCPVARAQKGSRALLDRRSTCCGVWSRMSLVSYSSGFRSLRGIKVSRSGVGGGVVSMSPLLSAVCMVSMAAVKLPAMFDAEVSALVTMELSRSSMDIVGVVERGRRADGAVDVEEWCPGRGEAGH